MSSQKVCSCNTWTLPQYLFFFLFLWCYHQLIEVKKLGNKLTSFHVWDNDVLEAKISCINLDVIFTASKNWKWRRMVPLFFMKNLHPHPPPTSVFEIEILVISLYCMHTTAFIGQTKKMTFLHKTESKTFKNA